MAQFIVEKSGDALNLRRPRHYFWLLGIGFVFPIAGLTLVTSKVLGNTQLGVSEVIPLVLATIFFGFVFYMISVEMFSLRTLTLDRSQNKVFINGVVVCHLSDITSIKIEHFNKTIMRENLYTLRISARGVPDVVIGRAVKTQPNYSELVRIDQALTDFTESLG